MEVAEPRQQFVGGVDRAVYVKKVRSLKGTPTGFPTKGAPIGLRLPVGKKPAPVDPGDTTIRYIQSDYFGEDYFGTDMR